MINHQTIDRKTLDRVSRLAELEIPKDELERMRKDLEKMVAFVDVMKELDLSGEEPLWQVSEIGGLSENILRDDVVTSGMGSEDLLENAPKRRGEFVAVPKTFPSVG